MFLQKKMRARERERERGKRKGTEVGKYESQNNIFCCYVVYEYLEIKHLCICKYDKN